MKNGLKIMLIISLFLSCRAGFVYASDISKVRDSSLSENRIINTAVVCYKFEIENIEDLEKLAELVVRAKVTADSENFASDYYGFTKTNVEVTEVFKGKASVGDTLGVLEPYFIGNSNHKGATIGGRDYLITSSGYLPSIVDQEYIFFISRNDYQDSVRYGYYDLVNDTMGRYPVLDQTKTRGTIDLAISSRNSDFSLTEDTYSTLYRKIFADVHQKYIAQHNSLQKD